MNRRRIVYPLLVLAVAALVLWFERRRAPEPKPLPRIAPIPYDGPLGMSPGKPSAPPVAPPDAGAPTPRTPPAGR